jgi:hypothetical protein
VAVRDGSAASRPGEAREEQAGWRRSGEGAPRGCGRQTGDGAWVANRRRDSGSGARAAMREEQAEARTWHTGDGARSAR